LGKYSKNKILPQIAGSMLDWYMYPKDVAKMIAKKEKSKRNARKLTQRELATRSGVTLASIKRFEQTGEISLVSLLKIAEVLEKKVLFSIYL